MADDEYSKNLELSSSLEDYLEAICAISEKQHVARSRDIVERLNVNSSSVTAAVKSLSSQGLVNYEPYGLITLTDLGESTARRIIERHEILRSFFEDILGVNRDEADEAACRIEHVVSREILSRMALLAEFMTLDSGSEPGMGLDAFREFCGEDLPGGKASRQ